MLGVPGLLDRYLARTCYEGQMTDEPADPLQPDNLFLQLQSDHGAHGRFDDRSRTSVTTLDPATLRGGLLALGLALCGSVLARPGNRGGTRRIRAMRGTAR